MAGREDENWGPYPTAPTINWSHPLANGLVFCFEPAGARRQSNNTANVLELVRNTRLVTGHSGYIVGAPGGETGCPFGDCLRETNNNDTRMLWPAPTLPSWFDHANFTLMCITTGVTSAASGTIFGQYSNTNSRTAWRIYDGYTPHRMRFAARDSAGTEVNTADTLSPMGFMCCVAVRQGVAIRLYQNGTLTGSGTLADASTDVCDGPLFFKAVAGANGQRPHLISSTRVWSRVLSEREIVELSKDPFGLVRPPTRHAWMQVVAAGASNAPRMVYEYRRRAA